MVLLDRHDIARGEAILGRDRAQLRRVGLRREEEEREISVTHTARATQRHAKSSNATSERASERVPPSSSSSSAWQQPVCQSCVMWTQGVFQILLRRNVRRREAMHASRRGERQRFRRRSGRRRGSGGDKTLRAFVQRGVIVVSWRHIRCITPCPRASRAGPSSVRRARASACGTRTHGVARLHRRAARAAWRLSAP